MALTNKLTAIADAIREKGGTTALLTLDAMPAAIAALEVGGGGSGSEDGVPNPILLTGNVGSAFENTTWNWVIDNFGNRIQTSELSTCQDMFHSNSGIEDIPFDFNFITTSNTNCASMFYNCLNLKTISGDFNDLRMDTMRYMFYNCYNLRYLPTFNNLVTNQSTNSMAFGDMFKNCYSLRSIPESLLKQLGNSSVYNTNGTIYNGLSALYAIDEIVGIPTSTKEMTSNVFTNTFNCYRAKRFVFNKKDDGSPYIVKWQNQTINLYNGFGWLTQADDRITTKYNSGITADKKVDSAATYEALKNDTDWFSNRVEYSRYNHDSAVETINSLPDASAYLATQSGTNTIKFRRDAGTSTDGGHVGNLTEEEIAVATAKGWSISYAV